MRYTDRHSIKEVEDRGQQSFDSLVRNLAIAWSLLIIPFIGNYVSEEVDWSVLDFMVMGLLLTFFVVGIETILRTRASNNRKRLLIFFLVLLALTIWIELAVGIF